MLWHRLAGATAAAPGITFIASATAITNGASITVNKPTGTQSGDIMIAVMGGDIDATWTGDTGWTEVGELGAVLPGMRVAYRVAGGSEGSDYTFTPSKSDDMVAAILTYRNAVYDTATVVVSGGQSGPITVARNDSLLLQLFVVKAFFLAGNIPGYTIRVIFTNFTGSIIVYDKPVDASSTETSSSSSQGVSAVSLLALSPI